MYSFGTKIRDLRKERKLSQDEVAVETGITKSTISKYEHNQIDPTLSAAKKLADFFSVTLDFLADDNNKQTEFTIPSRYAVAIKKAINENITSEQLEVIITVISDIKNN